MHTPATTRTPKRAWSLLTDTLHATLAALAPEQYLIIAHRDTNRFVQFACERRGHMVMEAASNQYIESSACVLTKADFTALKTLGWNAPSIRPPETYPDGPPDGSPNFWIRTRGRTKWGPIAERAVRTLRDVYRIEHPRELEYHAFVGHRTIYFPLLGLYPRAAEHELSAIESSADLPPNLDDDDPFEWDGTWPFL